MKYELDDLYRRGLISSKPFRYITMAQKYRELLASGLKSSDAIRHVSNMVGVSKKTVYEAVKKVGNLKESK